MKALGEIKMAYTHQINEITLMGTGGTESILTSGTAAAKTRYIVKQNCILKKMAFISNVIGVSAAKPTFTIRKVSGPGTTTATGTAVSGATLAVPAALAAGKITMRTKLNTAFAAGDHIVVQISTAATKAFAGRLSLFIEPDWEVDPQTTAANPNNANVYTVTA
jgi:hypothetical protein